MSVLALVSVGVLLSERLRRPIEPGLAQLPHPPDGVDPPPRSTPTPAPIATSAVPAATPEAPQRKAFAVFQDQFPDGTLGPKMEALPVGDFQIGSLPTESGRGSDELPHQVRIAKPFAIGQTEVTFEEYDRFATATKRDLPQDRWGRQDQPIIIVSWDDATAYAAWLAWQTGKPDRLPAEVEWEYAARAKTTMPFFTGACIPTEQANYDGTANDCTNCGAKAGLNLSLSSASGPDGAFAPFRPNAHATRPQGD